jgi:hypothetical protein
MFQFRLELVADRQYGIIPWPACLSRLLVAPRPAINDGQQQGCVGFSYEPAETRSLVY